jgi:tetratricopeptide (TPR) repeat protein
MPLFGGNKRARLDGLTKDEEKRRDALNPEVLRRAGEKGVAGQGPAAAGLLREKLEEEPQEPLWPLLLGWQQMSLERYAPAIDAFGKTVARDSKEIRGYFGAGSAFFQAAEAKMRLGDAATEDVVPGGLTVDNLYHESLRNFRRALELASDKGERDELQNAVSAVERALARKAGRL